MGPHAQPLENGEHYFATKTVRICHIANSQLQAAVGRSASPHSLPFVIMLSLHPDFHRAVLLPP